MHCGGIRCTIRMGNDAHKMLSVQEDALWWDAFNRILSVGCSQWDALQWDSLSGMLFSGILSVGCSQWNAFSGIQRFCWMRSSKLIRCSFKTKCRSPSTESFLPAETLKW